MNYSFSNNEKRRKAHLSHRTKLMKKTSIIIFRIIISMILISGFWLGGVGLGAYFAIINNAPNIPPIRAFGGDLTTFVFDRDGNEIDRISGVENRELATLDMMPQHLINAFIAMEDERFFSHNGVDFRGFARGIWAGVASGGNFQGGSTITQQFIKNHLGVRRNTIETKLQEQFLAIQFERDMVAAFDGDIIAAKNQILELYLNIIYFGSGQYGIRSAAMFYFGKELHELTIAESCALAAIIQNPYGRNPRRNPEGNRARQVRGIERMYYLGMITYEEKIEAIEEDIQASIVAVVRQTEDVRPYSSHFVDQVFIEVLRDLQYYHGYSAREASMLLHQGGLRIHTTKDSRIQDIVDEVYLNDDLWLSAGFYIEVRYYVSTINTLTERITHHLPRRMEVIRREDVAAAVEYMRQSFLRADEAIFYERIFEVIQPQSGFVIMDYRTGHVVAIAGGRGAKQTNRAFNRATQAHRQPGSVFKVLASFAPAIDMNLITPATVIDDSPFHWPLGGGRYYSPNNWYGQRGGAPPFRGHHNIRTAHAHSMNVITVKNMVNTGLEESFQYLLNFGFSYGPNASLTTQDRNSPVISLGGLTRGVTQLEVAAAFGAIANEGYFREPIFYTRVYDRDGNLLLDRTNPPVQVLRSTSAYLLTSMLQTSVHDPTSTGFRARLFRNNQPWMAVAGKTGTTQYARDITFVAYTPYFVASIYVGHDQPRALPAAGASVHLYVWREIMNRVHEDLEPRNSFSRPLGIVEANICRISGLLPTQWCHQAAHPSGPASSIVTEVFAAGTIPTETCTFCAPFTACSTSGMRATERCANTTTRVYRRLPAGSYSGSAWIHDRESWARLPGFCNQC